VTDASSRTDGARVDLRGWITERLDPLREADPLGEQGIPRHPTRSDFDLNRDRPPRDPSTYTAAAVLIALVERAEGLGVILTRRADTLRSHTGQVALPGGRLDPGETPWQGALREAHEEIGLDPSLVALAGLSTPYRTVTGYHVIPVVGFVTPPIALTPNPSEVADIFEPPFDFLMNPANHQRRQGQTPAGDSRTFFAMNWGEQLIWGATAGILRALHDRLYGPADD
jgi:8-oxo-dGTP pyrophosphatase MutT (NUDIX family)